MSKNTSGCLYDLDKNAKPHLRPRLYAFAVCSPRICDTNKLHYRGLQFCRTAITKATRRFFEACTAPVIWIGTFFESVPALGCRPGRVRDVTRSMCSKQVKDAFLPSPHVLVQPEFSFSFDFRLGMSVLVLFVCCCACSCTCTFWMRLTLFTDLFSDGREKFLHLSTRCNLNNLLRSL